MADWISILVVTLVCIFFIAVMYKALREPLDLVISGVKNAFGYAGERIAQGGANTVEVIRYD